MDELAIFLAGFPEQDPETKRTRLQLVHLTGDDRPYLTHKVNGLKTTRHHANLYQLSQDHTKVLLMAASEDKDISRTPPAFALSKENQKRIQKAIDTDYFFD